jgi:hypothetical protein
MKKYLLTSVLGICATAIIFMAFKNSTKETPSAQYILVEIYEIPAYSDKGIHIHYGGGKTEVIHFKAFTLENHDENGELILNTVNGLIAKGYELTSTSGGLAQSGMITKIFMKKVQ